MISISAGSVRAVLGNMQAMKASTAEAARAAVKSAGLELHAAVKQNISLRDHSPADLANLDHPYARRHGTIRIHGTGTKSIDPPSARVHTQTGRLLSALRSGPIDEGFGWRVELDKNVAPHAEFVVQGTRVMLPRDVLFGTAKTELVQRRLLRDIVRTLGRTFRTKASVTPTLG